MYCTSTQMLRCIVRTLFLLALFFYVSQHSLLRSPDAINNIFEFVKSSGLEPETFLKINN